MRCGRGLAHTTFLETSLFFFTPFSLLLFSLPFPGGEGRSHGKERERVGKVGLSSFRWGNWTEPPQGRSSRLCWGWPGPLVTIPLLHLSSPSMVASRQWFICRFSFDPHGEPRVEQAASTFCAKGKRTADLGQYNLETRALTIVLVQQDPLETACCHLSRVPTITSAPCSQTVDACHRQH